MSDDMSAISFRLPAELREKIQDRAKREERTEAGFLRYHLARLLSASEQEAAAVEHCEDNETAAIP